MGKLVSSATMSLDGFVARGDDSPGPIFDWYGVGDVEVASANDDVSFTLTPTSADYWRSWTASLGALLVGRVLFDITDGWGGRHPLGVPVVVVTHEPPTDWAHANGDFHFVDGVAAASDRAREIAGDGTVGVAAGSIASQCLALGLLDEVAIDLAPVVLGGGKPYFTDDVPEVVLGDPTTVITSDRVIHLVYPVERGQT